jgi:hypothetical protein
MLHIIYIEKNPGFLSGESASGELQVEKVFSKVKHSYRTVTSRAIDEAIYRYVEGHDYDLLVMLAHHHNVFERLVKKPHTYSMAFKIEIPMLVLRG